MLIKNLSTVYVFREELAEDVYVGTEKVDVYSHTVRASVQPAENRITAETYGERVYSMYALYCFLGEDIGEEHKLSFTNAEKPTHKVVSVKRHHTHKVLMAEVIS